MRIVIAAVGKLKEGSERDLCARYVGRVAATSRQSALGPIDIRELPEGRAADREARRNDEAERLVAKCKDCGYRIVLDENGKALTSRLFADLVARIRDRGEPSLAFLIGGPDGHGAAARAAADLTLSLSAMTLPHGLARVVLAEQIYRATTLLTGHPYHRG